MINSVNGTHDPELLSWVGSANTPDTPFPIQNLPVGVLRRNGSNEKFRVAVAIGDMALDLTALANTGLVNSRSIEACQNNTLNTFMSLGVAEWSDFRATMSRMLAHGSSEQNRLESCMIPLSEVEYGLPATIGDYTDFYASIHHARNVGTLFRPDNPLLPNYEWIPIGYHGRSSSIGVSGQSFPRPVGQLKHPNQPDPIVAPTQRLDYEVEVGIFHGSGNMSGEQIKISEAEDTIFGLCLLNDWSARDVQTWEYQPLGPFLAKSFATTISPWIVMTEALAPFRKPLKRNSGNPKNLPYLTSLENNQRGGVNIQLEAFLETLKMQEEKIAPQRLSVSNFEDSYWTMAQMVAHHTMNGCNLRPGDLFGSGTMSGADDTSKGALIELTQGGNKPVQLHSGETRVFLEDWDTVIISASCQREGYRTIGFGVASGTVLPATIIA